MAELRDVIAQRQSVYEIGKNTDVTADGVAAMLREVVGSIPSAGNSQTTRWVVVSGEKNDKVWDIIDAAQREALPEKLYEMFSPRFSQAKQGLGTILMFASRDAVASMPTSPERSTLYKENNHGIAAYATWILLRDLNLGASLQHFNVGYEAGFDREIREYLGLPDDWELLAEMPFGSIEANGSEKDKLAPEERVLVIS